MQPRRLLLIRHAQAADAPVDRDRPLTAHGARMASDVGSWLARADLLPDRIVVSPALRARQTWEQVAAALPPDLVSDVDDRIYENTVAAVLAVLAETPEDARTVAVVGHNPSVGELAFSLDDGAGDADARRHLQAGFPTGAVAVFEFAPPFDDLEPGTATLTAFQVPTA